MSRSRREEAPVLSLLRIALGGLSVYDGLVFKLLAVGLHLAPAVAWSGVDLPPAVQSRLVGALEVALGLLLLSGVLVRVAALLELLLLAALTIHAAEAMPHALLRPLGLLSRNLALGAATLALALTPGRGWDAVRQERLLAVVLRTGLGLMWLHEGLLVKWLPAVPVEVELLVRTHVVPPGQAQAFVYTLGAVEVGIGLSLLAGFRVRQLAVLQVGLLAALGLLIGSASPAEFLGPPGGLSRHLAMIGCALLLYQVGGGALAADGWLATSPTSRGWALRATLQAAWLLKVAMAEVYQVQARSAGPEAAGVLQKIERDDEHHGRDLRALLERHGARPWPLTGAVRAAGWLVACLTVIVGMRAALRVDLWAKARALSLYTRAAQLLPAEEGLTARALQAMQGREAVHRELLRDSLRPRQRRR